MILNDILRRMDFKHPNGQPIYAYELTRDEYEGILAHLQERSTLDIESFRDEDAAIFCMAISEWWRRHYDGGPWSWSRPLLGTGLELWCGDEYRSLTTQGLKYLRRKIIQLNGKNQYLGSLAAEGGLPLELAHKQDQALSSAFGAMFDELRIFGIQAHTPSELGARQMHRFPKTFQDAQGIDEILGRMALSIWELARLVQDVEGDPFEALDTRLSNWRYELPLTTREGQAKRLLELVFGEAHKAFVAAPKQIVAYRKMMPVDDHYVLAVAIDLPKRIACVHLAQLLGVKEDALPYRIKLKVRASNTRYEQLFAIASRDKNTFRLEPVKQTEHLQGTYAASTLHLVAFVGNKEFGMHRPIIAESLGDEPWAFLLDDDGHPDKLLTAGSFRTKKAAVVMATTTDMHLNAEQITELHEVLECSSRMLHEVSGSFSVTDEIGTRWSMQCNSQEEALILSSVRETPSGFEHTQGLPCFGRIPDVWLDRRVLSAEDTTWVQNGRTHPTDSNSYGDGFIRVLDDEGHVVFQKHMCLLPPSASFYVHQATKNNPGKLVLTGFGEVKVGCGHERVVAVCENVRDDVHVRFESRNGTPLLPSEEPAHVALTIRWDDQAQTTLNMPFPSRKARFIARDGAGVTQGVAHSIDLLCAEYYSTSFDGEQPVVRGSLKAQDASIEIQNATEFEHPLRQEYVRGRPTGRAMLHLSQIREHIEHAFAGTIDLDAYVDLRLEWKGCSNKESAQLKIYRYEGLIKQSGGCFTLHPRIDLDVGNEGLVLTAFRFEDPSDTHTHTHTTDDEWLLDRSALEPGTWCVVGTRFKRLSYRPYVFSCREEEDTAQTPWSIICAINSRERRRAAFGKLFEDAVCDPGHSSWKTLKATFECAETLPASTFDALNVIVLSTNACAMALCKANRSIEQWWSVLEELPFLWHLIGVKDWAVALHHTVTRKMEALDPELKKDFQPIDFAKHVIKHTTSNLGGEHPAMAYIDREHNLNLGLSHQELQIGGLDDCVIPLIEDAFRELLSRRDPDHFTWPKWSPVRQPSTLPYFKDLKLPVPEQWRWPTANAPIVAAIACAIGWQPDRADVVALRKIRSFDPRWFDFAYRVSLVRALHHIPDEDILPPLTDLLHPGVHHVS